MSVVEVLVDEIWFDELFVLEDDGDGYEVSDFVFCVFDNEFGYGFILLMWDDGIFVIID